MSPAFTTRSIEALAHRLPQMRCASWVALVVAAVALVAPASLVANPNVATLRLVAGTLGAAVPLTCPCNGDVNNNGSTNAQDLACMFDCVFQGLCACCGTSCDVNCDGSINSQDTNAVQCRIGNNPPSVCCPKPGGPCCMPGGSCAVQPPGQCEVNGGTSVTHCPPDGRCVPPADDCFTTDCGRTNFDFCNDPIPADFFGPGSEPFTGLISLGGFNDGLPDTRVHRFNAMLLDGPPETVPIELVQLDLVSCQPITVTINGGETLWNVHVGLSLEPVPDGAMLVTKLHENGGTFESSFPVLPRFTFVNVDNPADQYVLDFGVAGRPPTIFETTGTSSWVHNPTVPVTPCGVNFVPGIEEDQGTLAQCCTETCHDNPGGGHKHCTKQCSVCPTGACCLGLGGCIVTEGPGPCPGIYKGDGTSCDDTDGDGLADWFEENSCCQSSSACSAASSPTNADTDGDGVNDGQEISLGCDPCTANDCIAAGDDCWTTECGRTLYDFCETPIPPDFFDPGSLPFDGLVLLGGADPFGTDTIVRRMAPMSLPEPSPVPVIVPIELVQLNLASCTPITVVINGFDTLWDVAVGLSGNSVPPGQMEVTKTHPNGGTFDAQFNVLPRFVFTEVGNPGNVRVLDFGAQGFPAVPFDTVGGSDWVHELAPSIPHVPCSVGFVPGVEEDPGTLDQCCTETCHDNPGGGHKHCTKQCSVCPTGACCMGGVCAVVDGAANCPGLYKGDGTNCDDTDGDGIPNWFENSDCCQSSTTCNASSDPDNPDTDGDGITDGAEIAQGCDPCIPNDCFTDNCCLPNGNCVAGMPAPACAGNGGTSVPFCNGPRCIPPGEDCWNTDCGRTLFDFCDTPIPAGFFNPGSDPFTGLVRLGGPAGPPDTRVRRLDAMVVNNPGDAAAVPVELVQLSLVSCAPITVTGGGPVTQWNVQVGLSGNSVPTGAMTVAKQHPNGGTFDAQFNVLPRFVFTQVGNPGNVRVLDFGAEGIPPVLFDTIGGGPWVHDLSPSIPHIPCGVNFVPGVEEDPGTLDQCCTETCHAGPSPDHQHCTKQCNVCPTGACCLGGNVCVVVDGAGNCAGEYKGDGTNCDDSDSDGIPDWFENNDCCQPSTACNAASSPNNPDTDGDGVLDGQEIAVGCDPCEPGDCIPAGDDCFATSCGDTAYDFCETPIPGDFFYPGSQPFEGIVLLQGELGPPNADTVMRRLAPMALPNPGDTQTIPIELVSLDLVSCQPINVNGPVASMWNVEVTLSSVPAPQGSMTVRKTHPNGGTFSSSFSVQPVFTFTRVGNPGDVRVLDTGLAGLPPATLGGIGSSPWVRTPSVAVSPLCGSMFAPGVEGDPANLTQCMSAQQCCVPVGHAGPGHLHVTREICQPCPCGACCLPDNSCVQLEGNDPNGDCTDLGGQYQGDGTTCSDSDADGLADWFEKSDCCEPSTTCNISSDPNNPDTDGDGVGDGAEVSQGTDPCVASFTLDPPTSSLPNKVRFISFGVPSTSAGTDTAYRVELTDLYGTKICCNAGGTSCNVTVCTTNAQCGGAFPTCTQRLLPFEGQYRYLNTFPGGVSTCVDSATFGTNYRCGTLGCQPEYRDWGSQVGGQTMHVTGSAVAPDGVYTVSHIAQSCGAAPGANTCPNASPSLSIATNDWGDICSGGGGAPDGVANVIDIGCVVDKVKEVGTNLPEPRVWLKVQNPDPIADAINVIDIGNCVDAVKGSGYPFTAITCP